MNSDFSDLPDGKGPTKSDMLWIDAGLILSAVTVGLALYGGWTLISGWL